MEGKKKQKKDNNEDFQSNFFRALEKMQGESKQLKRTKSEEDVDADNTNEAKKQKVELVPIVNKPTEIISANYVDSIYGNAKPQIELKLEDYFKHTKTENGAIKIRDVQSLVLWIFSDGDNPKWVFVKNKPLIKKIVIVIADSISNTLWKQNQDSFPFLKTLQQVPTLAPGSKSKVYNGIEMLLMRPSSLTKSEKRNIRKKEKEKTPTKLEPPSFYTLSMRDLRENEYPIPSDEPKLEGWVTLKPLKEFTDLPDGKIPQEREVLAIDCEMCFTKLGLELTRVSIVDQSLKVVYDKLVLPHNPITDYNTRYSGIDAKTLEGVTTRIEDVQKDLLAMIPAETILVGHSLENDLRALKLFHTKVIDTSLLYPHGKGTGQKSALRYLVQQHLQRRIQEETHDSIADSIAAMELVQLKLKNGPSYGYPTELLTNMYLSLPKQNFQATMIDRLPLVKSYGAVATVNCVPVENDGDIFEKSLKSVANKDEHFVWTHLYELSNYYKNHCADGSLGDNNQVNKIISNMDHQLQELYQSASTNTLFIVTSCHGNLTKVKHAQNVKKLTPVNTQDNEDEKFTDIIMDARLGVTWVGMKN